MSVFAGLWRGGWRREKIVRGWGTARESSGGPGENVTNVDHVYLL